MEVRLQDGTRIACLRKAEALVLDQHVHDREGRLQSVVRLLRRQGFEHIVTEQESGLEGTELHNVFARRGN